MPKIPPISIVLNIGGGKVVSPKSKPPVRKKAKKKDDDEKGILLKGLADIQASIERLPHGSHTGGG